jgi:MYXO-CTERM domain-containing protein
MSAWYVFSALGFYPAAPGHAEYALGSPLFKKATINLENGKKFVISAPQNSAQNVYVQSATLGGQAYDRPFLRHADMAAGGELALTLGAAASEFGTKLENAPTSITASDRAPVPMVDRATGGSVEVSSENAAASEGQAQAFDDDSTTKWLAQEATPTLSYRFPGDRRYRVGLYTLTSAGDAPERDPSAWTLSGSNDGTTWTEVDRRQGQSFRWRNQTRVFSAKPALPYARYRLAVTANGGAALTQLAEIELLSDAPLTAASAQGAAPCAATESASQAVDGRSWTKWCSTAATPTLDVDLGALADLQQLVVQHAGAGGEDSAWNTKSFALSLSADGQQYQEVASVTDNTSDVTQHTFETVRARYLRLVVREPATARIFELEAIGTAVAPAMGGSGGAGSSTAGAAGMVASAGASSGGANVSGGAAPTAGASGLPTPSEKAGCGCSVASPKQSFSWLFAGIALAVLARRRARH